MAQRINITIPDGLFDRLQKVKSHFNISGVCREAIEREVVCLEFRIKETNDMNEIIDRLKQEKEKYDARYVNDGYVAGLEDAKNMSYEELAEIINSGNKFNDTDVWDSFQADAVSDLQSEDPVFDLGSYSEGWFNGVNEFWGKVRSKV